MSQIEETFNIISFSGDKILYYGASIQLHTILLESGNYKRHTDITIPLGHSRYGGPVYDLPPGHIPPPDLHFVAQIELARFSPFDQSNLLPKTGQLIFFADILTDTGKVIYTDVANDDLIRHTKEHEQDFFSGMLVDQIYADTETWEERFDETGEWDSFAGGNRSKMFGIFTHCQCSQEEIEEITFSDNILLLQIGENGFNDEGVFSVTIPKNDLINRNFDNCSFYWGQS